MPIYNSDENDVLSSLEETYRAMINEKKRYTGPLTGPDAMGEQPGDRERELTDDPIDVSKDKKRIEGDTWSTENEGQDKIGPKRTRNMKHTGAKIERPEVFNITRKKTTEPGKIKPKKGSEAHAKLASNRNQRADIKNNPEMYKGMHKRAAEAGGLAHGKKAHDTRKDKKRKLEKNRAKLEKDFEK
jgi:hypothetical protein